MTKYTAMIFLGIAVAVIPILGFPSWFRTALMIAAGLTIVVLAYLSSVTYCSNCEKLIDEADRALEGGNTPPSSASSPTTTA